MAIIGPNPVHYQNQPQLLATHRQVFDLLARRVQENRTEPLDVATQGQVSDAFEHARQAPPPADTPETPAGALARLATGFYNRLIQLGLLPARETQDVNQSMVGHSTGMITTMEALGSNALQYLNEAHAVRNTGGVVPPTQIPAGFMLLGRSDSATNQVGGEGTSRFHLSGQVQGNNLALQDGFYELPANATEPVASQRTTWAASTNGSYYYDDQFNPHRIPSDQPIVIPNRRTLLSLGTNLFWYENGQVQAAPRVLAQQIRGVHLTRALAELQSGTRPTLVMGRSGDFTVPGKAVSGRHAQITWDGQGFAIQDLGSTNGTTMDIHDQVEPVEVPTDRPLPLIPGARIMLGGVAVPFNPPTSPVNPV